MTGNISPAASAGIPEIVTDRPTDSASPTLVPRGTLQFEMGYKFSRLDAGLPVGESGFTDDYVIPKVLLLAAHTLSDRLALTYNIGPIFVTAKKNEERRTDTSLHFAVALSGAVKGPVSLFGEVYGAFASGRDRPDRHSIQAGTTVLLGRSLQIDVRGGFGRVDSEVDGLVGAGLAFRLPY